MSDTSLVESLQRSKRRWKTLALGLLGVIGLVIVLGTTSVTFMAVHAKEAALRAEMEALRAAEQTREALRMRAGEK
jgi:hypothetical protein